MLCVHEVPDHCALVTSNVTMENQIIAEVYKFRWVGVGNENKQLNLVNDLNTFEIILKHARYHDSSKIMSEWKPLEGTLEFCFF